MTHSPGDRAVGGGPQVTFVSHEATLTGAPVGLLQLIGWLQEHTELSVEVVLLTGGPIAEDFAALAPVRTVAEVVAEPPQVLFLNSIFSGTLLEHSSFPDSYVIARVPELGWAIDHVLPSSVRDAVLARADRFVAVSERVRSRLVDSMGAPAARVVTIHGVIPDEEGTVTAAQIDEARARADIPVGARIVGAVGARSWRKGADLFVQLAEVVTRRGRAQPVHFLWLGDHDGSSSFKQLADDVRHAGLDDRVHLLADTADPTPFQALMDVVVSTSREDPFPRVCLEAAALSRPIAAFDSGGVGELLAAADVAVLDYADVESMADQVLALLDDPDRAASEGARLAEVVRSRHTLAAGGPAMLAEIRRGLAERGPR